MPESFESFFTSSRDLDLNECVALPSPGPALYTIAPPDADADWADGLRAK